MTDFWHFVKIMAARRLATGLSLLFAVISAFGLGVGLLSLGPILAQVLDPEKGRSLQAMAEEVNAADGFWHVPEWIVVNLPTDLFDGVLLIVVFLTILTVLGATANFLHQYLSQTLATRTVADVRDQLFQRVLTLPLGRVVTKGPSEFIARLVRDAEGLQAGLVAVLGKSVAQITKGVAALIVAIVFDWKIVIAAIVVGPLLAVILRGLAKHVRRGFRGSLEAQQDLLKQSTETLQGLRAVKSNTAEDRCLDRFQQMNQEVVRNELRMRTARAVSSPVVETLAILVLAGLALLAAKGIIKGDLPFDRFLLSLGSLAVAGASFRPLAGIINEISAAGAPASRLREVLDEQPEDDRAGCPELPPHATSIAFEEVCFAYPGADHPALVNVTMELNRGERIAVVGPNGSGKTTLLSMLPRLLLPDSGRILIDGHDIANVTLHSLREQIGVVTQETFITQGTVAENIAFGVSTATPDRIREAAALAHADGFIDRMPQGYETSVAEQGASLSGGQRQRIAIARALLREPTILVLDEATSQIDSESEAAIADTIRQVTGQCTVLVIAHRLATVLDCHRIVVMDQGRVIDEGTHDELLSSCPLYARLTETQLLPSGA
ncbi:MAG: ABC transporter ATP-binding protein/permease [Phycisphaerales bacterium]|nr:ABC transporter ATP-binding protein/permease [Phycisphaerales bacterium]